MRRQQQQWWYHHAPWRSPLGPAPEPETDEPPVGGAAAAPVAASSAVTARPLVSGRGRIDGAGPRRRRSRSPPALGRRRGMGGLPPWREGRAAVPRLRTPPRLAHSPEPQDVAPAGAVPRLGDAIVRRCADAGVPLRVGNAIVRRCAEAGVRLVVDASGSPTRNQAPPLHERAARLVDARLPPRGAVGAARTVSAGAAPARGKGSGGSFWPRGGRADLHGLDLPWEGLFCSPLARPELGMVQERLTGGRRASAAARRA